MIKDLLPEDFYKSDEERDIVSKVEDWKESPRYIAMKLKDNYDMDVPILVIKGLKSRIRHLLGVDVIPLQKVLKLRDMKENAAEFRERKLIDSGGLRPLPDKIINLNEAKDKIELRYLIEYGIVRKMYKDYLMRKTSMKAYKDARRWFHEKYGE